MFSSQIFREYILDYLIKRTRAMLSALDAAVQLEDLRFTTGNQLEELKGDRAGQYSVRINNR